MKIPKEYKNLNKYGLTPKTIRNLIPNRDKIQEKPFWHNNAISAWCLSDNTIHHADDIVYSEYDEYWLGIYDEDNKVEFRLYSYGGICKYHPSEFLKSDEIENEDDLEIQVKFLERINQLIDDGVFSLPNNNRQRGEYMTNRDYLMKLDNERLARLIWSKKEEICDSMKKSCCNNTCLECIKKWLEMERNPKVEKWQIRREPHQGCFWLILYVNEENGIHDWCVGLDEYGHISKIEVDIVRTWVVWDENNKNAVGEFLERMLEND